MNRDYTVNCNVIAESKLSSVDAICSYQSMVVMILNTHTLHNNCLPKKFQLFILTGMSWVLDYIAITTD